MPGAIAAFDEAARQDPADPWPPLSRAAARLRGGDLEGARADLALFRRLRPGSPAADAVEALLAAAGGERERALALADRSCAGEAPAWARALRGALRARCGELDGAREDLDAALAREESPLALAARADALNRLGFFWLALRDLDRLRRLLPGDPEPDAAAVAIHRDQAQYAPALRRLSRLERLRPLDARWPRLRSEVLFVQGRAAEAARAVERAWRLAPGDAGVAYERVRLLALAGRGADAAHALACAPLPEPLRAHLEGYLRARRGDWAGAERLFRRAAAAAGPESGSIRERAAMYAVVAREMRRLRPVPRAGPRELRMMGLGYRQPFQVSVESLSLLAGAEIIYSNLSDAAVVDFVGLFGVPFKAIVFRRSDHDARRCARDVMPGFRRARVVGVVTRGHPLYYGRLAQRLAGLAARRGIALRVPGSTSLSDVFLALSDAPPSSGLQIRDCGELRELDPRAALILYNFAATGDWRAELPRRLMGSYRPGQPAQLLPGSGEREFSPRPTTLAGMAQALRGADEAVTVLVPPASP